MNPGATRALGPLATVGAALAWGVSLLRERGLEEPHLDAELLLADLLGLGRGTLLAREERRLDEGEAGTFRERIDRRARGEPVAYITGRKEFYSLEFLVDPRVMIPRPETELLVEVGVRFMEQERAGAGILGDIGTGSGAIAVGVAHRLPGCRVIATDRSPGALEVARSNALRHGVEGRIDLLQGELEEPLHREGWGGRLDGLLSNPPYVCRDDPALDPAVERYEPAEAVFPEGDPLEVYTRLARASVDLLTPGGLVACEVGIGMATAVLEAFESEEGLGREFCKKDLAGVARVVGATKRSGGGGGDG